MDETIIRSLELYFGALADPIHEQLSVQGFIDPGAEHHQLILNSVITLWTFGYLSDLQKDRLFRKLFLDIKKQVRLLS